MQSVGTGDGLRRILRACLLALLPALCASCAGGSGGGGSGGIGEGGDPTGSQVTLAWDSPTEDSDGAALVDLEGFLVYEGTEPGSYTKVTDVTNVTEFTTESLPEGTYYFVVTAYDSEGNESEWSNEVVVTLPMEETEAGALE